MASIDIGTINVYTLISEFEWDAKKAKKNLQKHGVSFEEALTVFADDLGWDMEDDLHSADEPRSFRLGSSDRNRILLVVYTFREVKHENEKVRIISARRASSKEKKTYYRS